MCVCWRARAQLDSAGVACVARCVLGWRKAGARAHIHALGEGTSVALTAATPRTATDCRAVRTEERTDPERPDRRKVKQGEQTSSTEKQHSLETPNARTHAPDAILGAPHHDGHPRMEALVYVAGRPPLIRRVPRGRARELHNAGGGEGSAEGQQQLGGNGSSIATRCEPERGQPESRCHHQPPPPSPPPPHNQRQQLQLQRLRITTTSATASAAAAAASTLPRQCPKTQVPNARKQPLHSRGYQT